MLRAPEEYPQELHVWLLPGQGPRTRTSRGGASEGSGTFFTLFFFGANSKEAPDSNYPILLLCSYKRKPKRGFVLGDTDKEAEGQRGVSGEAPAGARAPTEATTVGDGVAAGEMRGKEYM